MSQNDLAKPKKSKKFLFIGLGIALILSCCCVLAGVVGITQFTDVTPSLKLPSLSFLFRSGWESSNIVPIESDFYMAINPNIKDLANAKHLVDVYSPILEETDVKEEFESELEMDYDISFEEDIKPWMGNEIAVTIPDLEDVANSINPGMTLFVASTNQKEADAFLAKLRDQLEKEEYTVKEQTYEDVKYYAQIVEEDWETPVVFGKLKNFVVFATSEVNMKEVIDVSQGNTDSLAKNEKYKQLENALPNDAVAITFYDMEEITKILFNDTGMGFASPSETIERLEAFKAAGMALSLTSEGVAFDFVFTFDPDQLQVEDSKPTAYEGNLLDSIPDNALGFMAGQNLDTFWKNNIESMKKNPDTKQQLEDMGEQFGMTIDEELFSWASGEYTIAVIETAIKDEYFPPVGVFSIFEMSDQPKAENTLENIASLIQDFLFIEFYSAEINGVDMQVYEEAGVSLGYGFTPEHLVIGFTEEALSTSVSDDFTPITKEDTFQAVVDHLPSKNNGYFYFNIEDSWRLAYDNMSEYEKEEFNEVRPYLEPIKALGAAGKMLDPQDGIAQATIFIYIP